MNLKQDHRITKLVVKIISDLAKYPSIDRSILLSKYIETRLNTSLKTYYDQLLVAFSKITDDDTNVKTDLKIMKRLNKD